jgi:hypothetical protein
LKGQHDCCLHGPSNPHAAVSVQCGDFVTRVENGASSLLGAPDSAIIAAAKSGSPPTAQCALPWLRAGGETPRGLVSCSCLTPPPHGMQVLQRLHRLPLQGERWHEECQVPVACAPSSSVLVAACTGLQLRRRYPELGGSAGGVLAGRGHTCAPRISTAEP